MTEAELKITHVHKHMKSPADAFAYGFAEWFGRGVAFAAVIIGLMQITPQPQPLDAQTEQCQ